MFASTIALLAASSGLLATSILIGGFLAHARPAIAGESEPRLRRATALGGLAGLVAMLLLLLVLGLVT
jgi:hypothetical protein